MYPDARIVEIDVENGMTEVEIIDGRVCREVFFDASMNWLFTRTEVRLSDVPDDIMGFLKASEYGEYRVDDVHYYQTPDNDFYRFELELRDNDVKVDVFADGTVTLVNGNGNPGGDEDNSGGMVGAGIEEQIEAMYPGARILEQDWDDGYLEVEIWHDGREKSVYFNGSDEWVWSQWDVRASELPEAVTAALQAEYPDYRIDDAEFVETPDSEYYRIELEGRGGELDVRITPEGTIF